MQVVDPSLVQTILPLRRRWPRALIVVALIAAFLATCHLLKGHGYKSRVLHRLFPQSHAWLHHPYVTATRPGSYEGGVPLEGFIAADVNLPNSGNVVDGATVTSGSVRLFRTGDQHLIEAQVNTSGAGDSIVLKPIQPLELNTEYTFEVLPALKDTAGAPFQHYKVSFTTAAARQASAFPASFDLVPLPQTQGTKFTSVTLGPDHRLYAATLDGRIQRFDIAADGALASAQTYVTVQSCNGGPRAITGIHFDPAATASNLVLWVSHGEPVETHTDDWSSKISRLSGRDLENYQDFIVGLPRGSRDHLVNQMDFGPDGALYFGQASNTAMGAPDSQWNYRPERVLSAAILRADLKAITAPPLDVKTADGGGSYDPFASGAPLTLYATGVRNAFDVLWHSNGQLYAPVNGSSAGGRAPATPDLKAGTAFPRRIDADSRGTYAGPPVPGLINVPITEQDIFVRVEKGGYYGHPDPARAEYVLDGGHPANSPTPFEIPQYPVGTMPDRNWRSPAFDFGKNLAPCGLIEYKSDACPALKGKILVARFSGGKDILVLSPGAGGEITESIAGIDGFTRLGSPLSLAEDPSTGYLYVSEFGSKKLSLLRPRAGASTHVFRQSGPQPDDALNARAIAR
jgi:glucose/arabinose dehydrogenase